MIEIINNNDDIYYHLPNEMGAVPFKVYAADDVDKKIVQLQSELEQARRERDEARGFEKDESRRRQKMHAALVRVASSLNYFYAVRIAKNALEEDK